MTTERITWLVVLACLLALLTCRIATLEAKPLDAIYCFALGVVVRQLIETWKGKE